MTSSSSYGGGGVFTIAAPAKEAFSVQGYDIIPVREPNLEALSESEKDLQAYIVEGPQDDGPWGARGIGEHSMVPTIPAIANAIYDAIGIRFEGPPFTAEKVYLAMLDEGIAD